MTIRNLMVRRSMPKTASDHSRGNRTWYCGAWCGYGFHEDGLQSALKVCAQISAMPKVEEIERAAAE